MPYRFSSEEEEREFWKQECEDCGFDDSIDPVDLFCGWCGDFIEGDSTWFNSEPYCEICFAAALCGGDAL